MVNDDVDDVNSVEINNGVIMSISMKIKIMKISMANGVINNAIINGISMAWRNNVMALLECQWRNNQ